MSSRFLFVAFLSVLATSALAQNCNTYTCGANLVLISAAATTVCPAAGCNDATCCENACSLPTTVTGYDTTNCATNAAKRGVTTCTLACAANYAGTARATCATNSANSIFALSGCEVVVVNTNPNSTIDWSGLYTALTAMNSACTSDYQCTACTQYTAATIASAPNGDKCACLQQAKACAARRCSKTDGQTGCFKVQEYLIGKSDNFACDFNCVFSGAARMGPSVMLSLVLLALGMMWAH